MLKSKLNRLVRNTGYAILNCLCVFITSVILLSSLYLKGIDEKIVILILSLLIVTVFGIIKTLLELRYQLKSANISNSDWKSVPKYDETFPGPLKNRNVDYIIIPKRLYLKMPHLWAFVFCKTVQILYKVMKDSNIDMPRYEVRVRNEKGHLTKKDPIDNQYLMLQYGGVSKDSESLIYYT